MVVTIKKLGGSVALVIPRAMARELELAEGTELELTSGEGSLTLRKRQSVRRTRRPMKELLKGVSRKNYRSQSAAIGNPGVVGKEVW